MTRYRKVYNHTTGETTEERTVPKPEDDLTVNGDAFTVARARPPGMFELLDLQNAIKSLAARVRELELQPWAPAQDWFDETGETLDALSTDIEHAEKEVEALRHEGFADHAGRFEAMSKRIDVLANESRGEPGAVDELRADTITQVSAFSARLVAMADNQTAIRRCLDAHLKRIADLEGVETIAATLEVGAPATRLPWAQLLNAVEALDDEEMRAYVRALAQIARTHET